MIKSLTTLDAPSPLRALRTLFRGLGQVMFQENAWTGLLFLAGIFWGAYANGNPQVAWGALTGVTVSTLTGYLLHQLPRDGEAGLWGFNGALVGCAFPTFLGTSWLMWVCMIICAALSTVVRRAFNNVMVPWKVNSLTFPFVFTTWIFLLSAKMFLSLPGLGEATPELPGDIFPYMHRDFGNLVIYWLKGISQVFLINNWVTGIFFLVALFIANRWACMWAALASAIALAIACLMQPDGTDVANGLYGFSAVLTGIALGSVFNNSKSWRVILWTAFGVVVTVFVQAAMNVMLMPYGIATLTGPFCVTTWLFLIPAYKFNQWDKNANWKAMEEESDNKTN